jgi:hypothetical protein
MSIILHKVISWFCLQYLIHKCINISLIFKFFGFIVFNFFLQLSYHFPKKFYVKKFFSIWNEKQYFCNSNDICIVCDILKVCLGIAAEPTSSTKDSLKVSDSGIHHAHQEYFKECTLSNTLICSIQRLILLQHSSGILSLDSEHLVCDLSSFSIKQGTLCITDSAAAKYSLCCTIHFFVMKFHWQIIL